MKKSTKTIAVGALGYFAGFLAQVVSYLEGIRDIGGSWADFDGISIMSMALKSISTAVLALMAYLAKPPTTDVVPLTEDELFDQALDAKDEMTRSKESSYTDELEEKMRVYESQSTRSEVIDDLSDLKPRNDIGSAVESETLFDSTIDLSSAGYKNPNGRS